MKLLAVFAILGAVLSSVCAAPQHHHGAMVSDVNQDSKKNADLPSFTFAELYNMTANFFDNFMYPLNAIQAKKINSTMFSTDVLGRVDVTRNFVGQELNTEYAFGLFSNLAQNPNSFSLLGVPINYTIDHFAANEYVASVSVIIDFNITALGVVTPVEIDFWATFNKQKQIDQYDATFRYLQWNFDYLLGVGQELLHLNSTAAVQQIVQQKLAASICTTAQTYCVGDNQQYNSTADCFDFLANTTPFGQAYQMGMDTLLCRMVHQNMVPFRPDVHCPHIGVSGGGYCTNDRTYFGTVTEPFFTNAPFVPEGLQNKNKTIAAQ